MGKIIEIIKNFFKLKRKPVMGFPFIESYDEEDIVSIGKDADAVLKNPAFQLAFERYTKHLFRQWRDSTPLQTEGRESAWHRLEALDEVKLTLIGMVNNMKVERNKLEAEKILKGEK